MPNHVYNQLTVSGPKNDLLAFHASINFDGENVGIVRSFIPFPSELEGKDITDKDGNVVGRAFSDDGYQWCLRNWGTKWGDYETDVVCEPSAHTDGEWSVSYSYQSAWSPANVAIARIAELFPTLTFDVVWEEEGCQSLGSFVAKGDKSADFAVSDPPSLSYEDWENEDARQKFFDEISDLKDSLNTQAFLDLSEQLSGV